MHDLCAAYARRGFVAATIDYRKLPGGTILDSVNAVEAVVRTVQDMKAAVRYFRNDRKTENLYRADTNFIFVGGYSAGALTALHTAYWDDGDNNISYINDIVNSEGGLEGQSNDITGVSSRVQGVINHSGGIIRKAWIDPDEPPVVSYHGTLDNIVPIGHGLAGNAIILDGSAEIHERASQLGLPNLLYAVQGGGHTDIFNPSSNPYNAYLNEAFQFLEEILCSMATSLPLGRLPEEKIKVFPNPASDFLEIHCEETGLYSISIFDSMGRLSLSKALAPGCTRIDLPRLNPGLYTYLIKDRTGRRRSNGKLALY